MVSYRHVELHNVLQKSRPHRHRNRSRSRLFIELGFQRRVGVEFEFDFWMDARSLKFIERPKLAHPTRSTFLSTFSSCNNSRITAKADVKTTSSSSAISTSHLCSLSRYYVSAKYLFCWIRLRLRRQCGRYFTLCWCGAKSAAIC